VQTLSQRDTRWANQKLGTSSVTIGSYGCTITAISILLETTPNIVNNKMISGGGYANQNLVNWSKLPIVFSKIKKATRYQAYNNDIVSDAIKKYGGCLVEVDGKRIGANRHWVLYIGDQKMIDPWFGTVKATSYYPATGCAVIEVENTVETMPDKQPTQAEWQIERDERNKNHQMYLAEVEKNKAIVQENERLTKDNKALGDSIVEFEKTKTAFDLEIKSLREGLVEISKQLGMLGTDNVDDIKKFAFELANQNNNDKKFVDWIKEKYNTGDTVRIQAEIENQLKLEQALLDKQKDVEKLEEQNNQDKKNILDTLETLKTEIEQDRLDRQAQDDERNKTADKFLARIEAIEDKLVAQKSTVAATNRFSAAIEFLKGKFV